MHRKRTKSSFTLLHSNLKKNDRRVVSGLNLQGIKLTRYALLGIEFRDCEMARADFTGADLSLARFINCNLYLANFTDSVLYTTWFYESNLTKAQFTGAYLLGLRFRNVDITKAVFDDVPAVGLERKTRSDMVPRSLKVPMLGKLPCSAPELELTHNGIQMDGYPGTVVFLTEDSSSKFRTRIRIAETAKFLREIHVDNGYESRAAHYYVIERRHRRRAQHGSFFAWTRRIQDYLIGDQVWRYGSSFIRPIVVLALLALFVAVTIYFAPLIDKNTGLHPVHGQGFYTFTGANFTSLIAYLNVAYFCLTAPVGGPGAELIGWTKVVFVGYLLSAIWLLALIFEASTRRLGRSL